MTTQANIPPLRPDGPPLVLAVDAQGQAVDACDALVELIGPEQGAVLGVGWRERVARWCQSRVDELLQLRFEVAPARVLLVGKRTDGLPFVMGLSPTRLGREPTSRLLVGSRLGGPVHWRAGGPTTGPSGGRGEPHVRGIDSVLSHDVRGALRGATGFTTVVSRAFADARAAELSPALAKVEEHLGIALGALASADNLVDEVVRFLRAADEPLVVGRVNIGELVEGAIDSADHRCAQGLGRIHLDPDAASLAVLGDVSKLTAIVTELLVNSSKFGGKDVSIMVTAHANDDGWTELVVSDDGPGLDHDLLEDAFAPGRLLQPRGRYPGVGMGLALCRLLATRHAGRCEFDAAMTAPGRGTTVKLVLPSADDQPARVGS
ncbi:MAG: ATP-binding protein [Acidimicrobiales bacterium]|nr:ATP-binding protein [Acidimicrobiales bacterium]